MRHKPLLVACFIIFAGISAVLAKVTVDWDRSADFSRIETYQWLEGTPVPNPLMHQRVIAAIENQLAIKGIRKVESEPNVFVVYHASASEELNIDDFGYGRPRWGYSRDIRVNKYLVGTLLVDILRGEDQRLIWRGTGSETVSDNPQKNEKKVNKICEKMFKKFPPSNR